VTREQRGEKTATYCIGDTLRLILMSQVVIMLVSMVLQIHHDVGFAVRQVEVEGGNAAQVGVDGGHRLSLIINNGPTNSTSMHHFTSIT
jgi:hypothetical protein